jgi:hypothetical protein
VLLRGSPPGCGRLSLNASHAHRTRLAEPEIAGKGGDMKMRLTILLLLGLATSGWAFALFL